MDEQQRMQTYANAFVHCLPVAARTLNDIHAALQRIVCGYDAGARRRLVSFSAEQKKDRPSLEVERNGLISRHDFCTALNNFFVRRPELSFDPECVFDTFFTGERGALVGAEAFAPPGDEQLDKSPGACAVRFATGEIESDYPLRLLQCCPAHVTRRSVLPSHPAEIEELEAAAHVQDSGLCKNVLDATSEQPCRVMARPRRASLRDIAAGIYNLYSGDAAGEWRAKGRAGVSEAIQRSGRAAMASNDEASRRRQLLYLLRRRSRSGRDKSTWFDHLGSLGAVLSTWNCQANPARGRHDDGSRLAPMISSLGQKENENKVTFEQFLVSLKHYLGEIRRADAGPRAADEECRVPFLQRDARLLFDAFEPDKSDRVCVAAIVRVVNSEAPDVETQSTSTSGVMPAPHTVKQSSGGVSAPFYTDVSTCNSRTWDCDAARPAETAFAACTETRPVCSIALFLWHLQCAIPEGKRHYGALLGVLANYEEAWTTVREHKFGPLDTKMRSTTQHKTGWLSRREFGAALHSLLPRQKLHVVLSGAAALFEERAKQLEVDKLRRVIRSGSDVTPEKLTLWPYDSEEFDPRRKTSGVTSDPVIDSGPTWLFHAVNVSEFSDWLAQKLATDLCPSSERTAHSRRWRGPLLTARSSTHNDLHSMLQLKRDEKSNQRVERLRTRNLKQHDVFMARCSSASTASSQQYRTYAPHRPPPCLARHNQCKATIHNKRTPSGHQELNVSQESRPIVLNNRKTRDIVAAIKATVREQAAPANGIDIVSREQQRVFLERAIGGFSTGGEHSVLSRGNFIASIRALLGKRAEQFDEPSAAGWQQYLARMRSNNARWTATDAHRMAFHAQWQTQHAVAYGALFDEAYEAMKTQQPENDDEADSDKSANQTQYSFMRDTLGLDYGQRFTLNSRGSWAADSINQVPPKFYAKHLAGRMNAKAAKITNSGDTDDRTITLNAAVEFMRDPQQCAFEAWDSRRQKAGFQAWQEGDPTEGWISRDDLKRQSRPVPKAEAFTV